MEELVNYTPSVCYLMLVLLDFYRVALFSAFFSKPCGMYVFAIFYHTFHCVLAGGEAYPVAKHRHYPCIASTKIVSYAQAQRIASSDASLLLSVSNSFINFFVNDILIVLSLNLIIILFNK